MISKEEVERIAKLSRINLKEIEIENFQKDFSKVLDYFSLLKKAKITERRESISGKENILRKDIAIPEEDGRVERLIELAPAKEGRQIKVKAILNG